MAHTAPVCGVGGLTGGHLVKRLKREGFWVRGVDVKFHEHAETEADDFAIGDLRDPCLVRHVTDRRFDEVCQLAADMGGAGRDGKQARSFLYIDECAEETVRLLCSDFEGPVNIGSEERMTMSGLAGLIAYIAGRDIRLNSIPGPQGVRVRTSDNRLIREKFGWSPSHPQRSGLEPTCRWLKQRTHANVH